MDRGLSAGIPTPLTATKATDLWALVIAFLLDPNSMFSVFGVQFPAIALALSAVLFVMSPSIPPTAQCETAMPQFTRRVAVAVWGLWFGATHWPAHPEDFA